MIALVLAAALAIAGYSLMLALRRGPIGVGEPSGIGALPVLPEPTRLQRRPDFAPAAHGSSDEFPAEVRRLPIEVRALPRELWSRVGVGVFDDDGMRRDWVPLAGDATGVLRGIATVPVGTPLRVVVAADDRHARRCYWARTDVTVDAEGDPAGHAAVELAAPVQQVVVNIEGLTKDLRKALRLRRVDDPEWSSATALRPTADEDPTELVLQLGPGDYELAPWTPGSWQPMHITVPGPSRVVAGFAR